MSFLTDLTYRFQPAQAPTGRRRLLLVFHGQGDHLEPYLSLPEELELPEFNYLFLQAPWSYAGGYQWARDHQLKSDLTKIRQNLGLLFLDLFSQGYRPHDLFLFGLSQGAMLATHLMMFAPYSFGGVVAVSGYVYFGRNPPVALSSAVKQTPFLMSHGRRDREIPIALAERHFRKLQRLGVQGEWWEFNKGHVIDDQVEGPMIGDWLRLCSQSQIRRKPWPNSSFEEIFSHVE